MLAAGNPVVTAFSTAAGIARRLCVAVTMSMAIFAGVGTASVSARTVTAAETASLEQTVANFNAAMTANDFVTVAKVIPPKVLAFIAKSANVDVEALNKIIIEQMAKALADVKITTFSMDLLTAEHRELADGTPYVLVPTETVIALPDGSKTRVKSSTLALLDENVWYLLRVSDAQQLQILRQVYPQFVGVEFPAGSMEAVED